MPIPFNFPLIPVGGGVDLSEFLKDNKQEWMVWWYWGINKKLSPSHEPLVSVVFRERKSDGLWGKFIVKEIPLAMLGQVRIGTVWQNGRCCSSAKFDSEEFEVDFSDGGWRFVSFQEAAIRGDEPPFPLEIHELKYPRDKTQLIEFKLKGGGKLVVPCIEFFSRCYGRSQELKRILATYPWEGETDSCLANLYAPLDDGVSGAETGAQFGSEASNVWKVRLRKRLTDDDAVFLAHAKYDPETEAAAKSIYAQIERGPQPEDYGRILLQARPWFKGPAQILVNGIRFGEGRIKSFFGLQVDGGSDPVGCSILRDRENSNKAEDRIEDALPKEEQTEGTPRGSTRNRPDVTITGSDSPDSGSATVLVEDPEFKLLGTLRAIKDVRRSAAEPGPRTSSGESKVDKFSSGAPYGGGKGVGQASVVAVSVSECSGVLSDMWNALRQLRVWRSREIKPVESYTFEHEFRSDPNPSLISLAPFLAEALVTSVEKVAVKRWGGKNTGNGYRGILVARFIVGAKHVFILELERISGSERRSRVKSPRDRSDAGSRADSFKGIVWASDAQNPHEIWLKRILVEICKAKGIADAVVKSEQLKALPGKIAAFKHVPATEDRYHFQSAVLNGLGKVLG